jgi:hypothetical protein
VNRAGNGELECRHLMRATFWREYIVIDRQSATTTNTIVIV